MTGRRYLVGKQSNREVAPQAIWPIQKSLMKKDGRKAPITIRAPYVRKSQRDWWLFGRSVYTTKPAWRTQWKTGRGWNPSSAWRREQPTRPLWNSKAFWCTKSNELYQIETWGIDGIPTSTSRTFQEGHWLIWHTYLIIAFGCYIFIVLEGSRSDILDEVLQETEIPSKFTCSKSPVHNGQVISELYTKKIPETGWRK